MKVVSLIPARKGSKGIQNKNLVDLCGKPLIYYSIKASIQSLVDETWVSSDSEKILDVSKKFGAKTLKRPSELARDETSSEDVLLHFAKNINFDVLVFIQCTAPFIISNDINNGIDKIKNYDSVVSVSETNQFFWDANGPLYDLNNRTRRQNSIKRYLETGSIFITSKINLLQSKNRLSGKIGLIKIPKNRSFDIDDHDDLEIVRLIMQSKINIDE